MTKKDLYKMSVVLKNVLITGNSQFLTNQPPLTSTTSKNSSVKYFQYLLRFKVIISHDN